MSFPLTNTLLERLPYDLRSRFLASVEPVALPVRTNLYAPGKPPRYLHFITSGISAIVTWIKSGDGVEVGLVGREGTPESLHLLGPAIPTNECFVQVAATALRIDIKALSGRVLYGGAVPEDRPRARPIHHLAHRTDRRLQSST